MTAKKDTSNLTKGKNRVLLPPIPIEDVVGTLRPEDTTLAASLVALGPVRWEMVRKHSLSSNKTLNSADSKY